MSKRRFVMVVLGACVLLAACASPVPPERQSPSTVTLPPGRLVSTPARDEAVSLRFTADRSGFQIQATDGDDIVTTIDAPDGCKTVWWKNIQRFFFDRWVNYATWCPQ